MTTDASGNVFAIHAAAGVVYKVDTQTRATTGAQALVVSGIIGAFTVGANGVAHIAMDDSPQAPNYHIYRLDLTNGATVLVSNNPFTSPLSLATDADGTLIVSDQLTIQRVYPALGAVAVVSSGGQFMAPWGVTLEANGTIVVVDNQQLLACSPLGNPTCRGALYRVDPVTGAQTLVCEQGMFWDITGVDIYRGPDVVTPVQRVSWGHMKTIYR